MKAGDARSGPHLEAQQVKAGDAVVCSANGAESRSVKTLRTRARRKRRFKAVAAVLWLVAPGSWLVARAFMRTVTRSSSSTVGVSTEGSQRWKRSILQRVLGARNTDPIEAGDEGRADREAASQGVSRSITRSDDETRAGSQPGVSRRFDETRAKWT